MEDIPCVKHHKNMIQGGKEKKPLNIRHPSNSTKKVVHREKEEITQTEIAREHTSQRR